MIESDRREGLSFCFIQQFLKRGTLRRTTSSGSSSCMNSTGIRSSCSSSLFLRARLSPASFQFHSAVSVSALDLNSSLWRVTVMIREFQRDDINKVADIWLDTNIKAHNFIPAEYWKGNFKSVKGALLLAEVYVYEYDTEIQGFIGLNDEYVEGIFVSDEMQSQGIGKILLNYAKDKRNKLHLNVYQKNTRAISFYKREGFEIQHSGLDEATGEKDYVMTWQRK